MKLKELTNKTFEMLLKNTHYSNDNPVLTLSLSLLTLGTFLQINKILFGNRVILNLFHNINSWPQETSNILESSARELVALIFDLSSVPIALIIDSAVTLTFMLLVGKIVVKIESSN